MKALRSVFELNKLYGFTKFIIVVPSIAIKEGVSSSISLMKDHFRSQYNNAPFDAFVYNSSKLECVRNFGGFVHKYGSVLGIRRSDF